MENVKKVLFCTDMFFPKPNANGLCVDAVAQVLSKLQWEVHVLCYRYKGEVEEEKINGVIIHRVRPNYFYFFRRYFEENYNTKKGKIAWLVGSTLHKIGKLLHIMQYPLESWISTNRYTSKALDILERNKIENVVALYQPLTSASVLIKVKETSPKCKKILYIVDSFCDGSDKKSIFLNDRNWNWEQKIYNQSDLIINMECHKAQLSENRYSIFAEKMRFCDIPVSMNTNNQENSFEPPFDNNQVNIVYCGTIYNPQLFEWFMQRTENMTLNGKRIALHIWARKPNDQIINISNRYDRLSFHGSISDGGRNTIMSLSDGIFSECPSGATMIPSKLFVSMISGNFIIHISDKSDDICINYLEKYGNYVVFKTDELDIEDKLKNALAEKKKVRFEKIEQLFFKNNPQYTANLMNDFFEGKKC